jgi:hypothetical protein
MYGVGQEGMRRSPCRDSCRCRICLMYMLSRTLLVAMMCRAIKGECLGHGTETYIAEIPWVRVWASWDGLERNILAPDMISSIMMSKS